MAYAPGDPTAGIPYLGPPPVPPLFRDAKKRLFESKSSLGRLLARDQVTPVVSLSVLFDQPTPFIISTPAAVAAFIFQNKPCVRV